MITTSKDPGENTDYQLDWSAEIGSSDTIASSTWTVPSPLTAAGAGSISGKTTQTRISGGVLGRTYVVSNQIVLSSGQTKVRNLSITIERL